MARLPVKLTSCAKSEPVVLASCFSIEKRDKKRQQEKASCPIDIDRELTIAGPCECGQLAVACSIRMILEKELFCCEACGSEFYGEEYPSFFEETVSNAQTTDQRQLFSCMKQLYSFIYGSSNQITGDFLSKLLKDHPQYTELFPFSVWSGEMILDRLESDKTFAEEFPEKYADDCPWGNFTTQDWLRLFAINEDLSEKCNKWQEFTAGEWLQIKRQCWMLYSTYFNKKTLGTEAYLKLVAEEPALLEKLASDVRWEIEDAADTIADAAKNLWRKLW